MTVLSPGNTIDGACQCQLCRLGCWFLVGTLDGDLVISLQFVRTAIREGCRSDSDRNRGLANRRQQKHILRCHLPGGTVALLGQGYREGPVIALVRAV